VYNARVALEFAKLVLAREQISLPTASQLSQTQHFLNPFFKSILSLRNAATSANNFQQAALKEGTNWYNAIRSSNLLEGTNAVKGALTAFEIYAFFCIGEIIGRRSLIGYDVGHSKHHHH
jgi:F-type H+-transporting ATPase subunit g